MEKVWSVFVIVDSFRLDFSWISDDCGVIITVSIVAIGIHCFVCGSDGVVVIDKVVCVEITGCLVAFAQIGVLQWTITLGRFDIDTAVMTMSGFRVADLRKDSNANCD